MSKPADWTNESDDIELSATLSPTAAEAETADTLLVGELEVATSLISYLVTVGRHREALGLLNDIDRRRLRDIARCTQEMIEVLDGIINLKPDTILDGGEQ